MIEQARAACRREPDLLFGFFGSVRVDDDSIKREGLFFQACRQAHSIIFSCSFIQISLPVSIGSVLC